MRMGIIAGAIVLATAACGSAAATAIARCGPAGAKTLVADHLARVYSSGGSVYGCTDASGHRYRLGWRQRRPGQPDIGKVALAGAVVAYGATSFGVDTAGATVTVRRLDTGRTLRSLSAIRGPVGPESFQLVDALVVKSDGAVAWIAHASSIVRKETRTEVNRSDQRGEATLDSTAAGDIRSLRLHGSRISWRHGSAFRSSTLS